MPLLWRGLGPEAYGLYVLALGYAALAGSLGSTRGAAQRMAAAEAGDDPTAVAAAAGGAWLAAGATGIVALVMATALAPLFLRGAGLSVDGATAALRTILLAGAAAPAMHLAQASRGILLGLRRYGASTAHLTVTVVMATLGTALLAVSGSPVDTLMLWLIAVHGISGVAGIVLVVAVLPVRPRLSWAAGWATLRLGLTLVATEAIVSVHLLAERAVLSRAAGTGAVAEYTIPLSLASLLQHALAAGAVVLLPLAGAAWVRGDTAALQVMYARAVKVVVFVAVGASLFIAGITTTLVGWWIEPTFAAEVTAVVWVLLGAFAVNALMTPIWYVSEGAGRPLRNTVLTACLFIVAVGAGLLLARPFGALGIAWARALAVLAVPGFVWLGEHRLLGRVQRRLWLTIAREVSPAGLVLGAAAWVARRELDGVALVGVSLLLLCGYGAWLWRSSYFDADDRRAIGSLIGVGS